MDQRHRLLLYVLETRVHVVMRYHNCYDKATLYIPLIFDTLTYIGTSIRKFIEHKIPVSREYSVLAGSVGQFCF